MLLSNLLPYYVRAVCHSALPCWFPIGMLHVTRTGEVHDGTALVKVSRRRSRGSTRPSEGTTITCAKRRRICRHAVRAMRLSLPLVSCPPLRSAVHSIAVSRVCAIPALALADSLATPAFSLSHLSGSLGPRQPSGAASRACGRLSVSGHAEPVGRKGGGVRGAAP